MYNKFKNIINKTKKYKLIFCDTPALLLFLKYNKNYKKSLIEIMKIHRDKDFEIVDFVIENYLYEEKGKKVKYLIIYNNKEIVSISRIIYDEKIGYINAVHTNIKFRRKKLCQRNIKKLITLTNNLCNIKIFELEVDIDNIPAIKCYKRCGFKIVKKYNNKFGKYYIMIKKI